MTTVKDHIRPVSSIPAATYGAGHLTRAAAVDQWRRLLRPRQWVKNGFVLAPLLFAGVNGRADQWPTGIVAFVLFCLVASGIYCWNDVMDRVADRAHPVKKDRPVASGAIRPGAAAGVGTLLVTSGVLAGLAAAPALGGVLLLYVALNILYTVHLKSVVILDVFAIAGFFVLRLLAGCAAIGVAPSVWLLLCGGLLSLYLGFAKRRHELLLLGDASHNHRSVLTEYDAALLDQISAILLSVTVVSYVMYALTSPTAARVGSEALSYSTVFVLYGMFRYLWLVHRERGHGGDPTETLLTDRPLLIAVALWLAYCGIAIYRPF